MELSVRDLVGLFNVSEETVYRWVKQKKLPACRVNEQFRFNRAEVLEWATSSGVNVPASLINTQETEKAVLPGLGDCLAAGGIHYNLPGSDKAAVLEAVVRIMDLPEDVDRSFLYQVLLAREALGSTGVGDGIAIPHVRNPIILHLPRPMIALCFLEKPIDFGAIDGQPVGTLFTVISPTVRGHLHLLSKIAYALRDPLFKSAVTRQAGAEEILTCAAHVEENLHFSSPHSP